MKKLIAIALATGAMIVGASAADAAQGCGAGFHRGPRGRCVSNRPAPPRYVVGRYYPGRGYWYRDRFWRQRYRYHNGWRYR